MSIPPPQPPARSGTKASLRDIGRGVREIGQDVKENLTDNWESIKRRMSSSLSGDVRQKKRPKMTRRLSVMGHRTAERLGDIFGRYSPRHSSSMEQSDPNYGFNANQYQPSPATYELPRNSAPHVMFESEASSNPAYDQESAYLQASQPHEDWSMSTIPGSTLDPNMNKSPTTSSPVSDYPWGNVHGDINMNQYSTQTWQQQPTASTPCSREVLLGSHSVTPPPDLSVVEGPIREMNELSTSGLRGTHRHRYTRILNTTNELGALVTGNSPGQCLSPADVNASNLSPIAASPSTPVDNGLRRGSGSSGGESFVAGDDNGQQTCPWPECHGTNKSSIFESNRLKEHIRRVHLLPFMCDSEGCEVRKGDKHQIYRHRAAKHPHEPEKRCKEQDQDPVALKKYKALNERGLSYVRISEICKATTLDDLEEAWERKARASSSQALKMESPISPGSGVGLGLPRGFDYSPQQSHRNSITFADSQQDGTPYPSGYMGHSPSFAPPARLSQPSTPVDPTLVLDGALKDFVNNVLAPHVDAIHLRATPQPTRESRDDYLRLMVNRLMVLSQEELDRRERRRSTVSNGTTQQSYTDMISPNLEVPPALTNANTHTLTTRSVSQGSLNPSFAAPFVHIQESPSSERFPYPVFPQPKMEGDSNFMRPEDYHYENWAGHSNPSQQ